MINVKFLKENFIYHPDGYLLRIQKDGTKKRFGSLNPVCGYRAGWINKKWFVEHRLIFLYHHGYVPEQIDHINRDRTDNRIENLRAVTHSENMMNRIIKRNSTSKFIGVVKVTCNKTNPWHASISHNKKRINIGYFPTEESAAVARDDFAVKLHGEFAVLNFPHPDGQSSQ